MDKTEPGARGSFRELLRRYRLAAGLSQEVLAERAGLSVRGLSDLERGVNLVPHADTVARLARALGLSAAEQTALDAPVVRTRGPGRGVAASQSGSLALPAGSTLPALPAPLVGREHDVQGVAHLLRRDDVRLATLTGPAGVGKTSLAIAVAADLSKHFAGGAVFVSLAPLRDASLVASAIAQALNIREQSGQPLSEALAADLAGTHVLLVLDNFEHVAKAALLLADLTAACARLKVLVTSRVAVHVRGEHEFPVRPLALPDMDWVDRGECSMDELARVASVTLFMQRAQAIEPETRLTPATAAAIAAICRRLDGLPLAIELTAVWVKLLPPQALLSRLEKRLQLLTRGASDLPERQQTLRSAFAWSYNLLHVGEQTLFRRLAVFAGGFTLEAAETVCQMTGGLQDDMLGWLLALVDKNLMVRMPGPSPEARFGMLDTIREYGLECLATAGEARGVSDRHAAYYLALAEQAWPGLQGAAQAEWVDRLEREHGNIRAAFDWSLQSPDRGELGLRLAVAVYRFWLVRGYLSEGRGWLERMLAASPQAPAGLRARALNALGNFANEQGDLALTLTAYEEAVELFGQAADARGATVVLVNQGSALKYQGDYVRAEACYEEATRLARTLVDDALLATVLTNHGALLIELGRPEQAMPVLEEGLALTRQRGNTRGTCIALLNLADAERMLGHLDRATALLTEHKALAVGLGDRSSIAMGTYNLGLVLQAQGGHARAAGLFGASLALEREIGNKRNVAQCLEALAATAAELGAAETGGRLFGAAAALRDAVCAPVSPAESASYRAIDARLRHLLGETVENALRSGRSMPLAAAIDEASALAHRYGR